jgi:hypothetical protein
VLGDQTVEKMQLGLKEPKEKKEKQKLTVVQEYEDEEERKIGD